MTPPALIMRTTLLALRHWTLAGVCFAATLHAQPSAGKYDPSTYEHSSADIAMRDGVKLHVEIFYPRGATEPLPFLFERTPYGVGGSAEEITVSYKDLAEDGYIFVFEDIRGRYRSEGKFVMQRPPKPVDAPGQAIDETTDTNDSIDWMLARIPNNNGRVGMLGVSYDGWTAAMGMLGGHKALRAVSPQASPADMIVLPETSIVRAPAGTATLPSAPTATMRLFVTTTSPRGMTSSPFIVMMRAPFSTTVPVGRSFAAVMVMSVRVGS